MIEVRDLLAQNEIFEKRRPAKTGLERILIVADEDALTSKIERLLAHHEPLRRGLEEIVLAATSATEPVR